MDTRFAFPTLAVSAQTGEGLDAIGPFLFQELALARVYTKAPGKPPEMDRPAAESDPLVDTAEAEAGKPAAVDFVPQRDFEARAERSGRIGARKA